MSENNRVTVDKIYIRWIDIQTHLNQCIQSNSFDQAIEEFLQTQFTSWLTKQITILHRVTHYLHSTHYNKSLNVFKQGEILCFLRSHTESQYHTQIESKFFEFREREEIFNSRADAWNNDDDSVLFWRKQISKNFYLLLQSFYWSNKTLVALFIKRLARRLFQTPANSVPSERVFLLMNYIHSKLWNRLTAIKVNRLQYIYINERTLRKIARTMPTEEELIGVEDQWLKEQGSMLEARERDEEETEITL